VGFLQRVLLRFVDPRVGQRQASERMDHDAGHGDTHVLLVIGWDGVPGREYGGGLPEDFTLGLLVGIPALAHGQILGRKFPVLVGPLNAPQKASGLLIGR